MTARHEQRDTKAHLGDKRRKDVVAQDETTSVGAAVLGSTILPGMAPPRGIMGSSDILALQRIVGNQAVQRLLDQHTPAPIQRKGKDKGGAVDLSVIDNEHAKYTPNFATPQSTEAPSDFKVTVAVSMKVPEYLTFAKTRMNSTIRNKVRGAVRSVPGASALVRKPKSGTQIKEKAAVKAAGKAPGTPTTDPAVQEILANSDSVGHSWIKISPVGASGAPIQTYSFGFVPADLGAAHGPQQAVGGQVRNPDLEFEEYTDFNNRYLDTKVNAQSYQKALLKIGQLKAGPPAYMTIGYNCTQFTKDIANAAGATFPSKAGMMIPFSDRGFMKRAMSPNALYDKLGDDLGTQDTSTERDMLQDPAYEEGPDGIREQAIAAPSNRGLELIDIMVDEDDPSATLAVDKDAQVLPTGASFGNMLQVTYQGLQLYASKDALIRHLEQLEPHNRRKGTLKGSLSVTLKQGGARVIQAGKQTMVTGIDGDQIKIESAMPDAIRGTCEFLAYWQAVSGVDLGA